jgi:hypothetical protein
MPVRQPGGKVIVYDASPAKKSQNPVKRQEMATRVITLRSERGYSATHYDGSAVKCPKTLRCQFGNFYDGKKVRNSYSIPDIQLVDGGACGGRQRRMKQWRLFQPD